MLSPLHRKNECVSRAAKTGYVTPQGHSRRHIDVGALHWSKVEVLVVECQVQRTNLDPKRRWIEQAGRRNGLNAPRRIIAR